MTEGNFIIIKSAYFPYKQIKLALHNKGPLQASLKQEYSAEDGSVSTDTVKTGSSAKNPMHSKTWNMTSYTNHNKQRSALLIPTVTELQEIGINISK